MINNSIMAIKVYDYNGIWVFDDEKTGLVREAFVAGIDDMIDILIAEIPNAKTGFLMLFSETGFPTSQVKLTWLCGDKSGNWYHCEQYQIDGWLCPALFKYFDKAPLTIYAEARAIK